MHTIAIFARKFSAEHRLSLQQILGHIELEGGKVLIYEDLYRNIEKDYKISNLAGTFSTPEELKSNADFIISLGGDGTLLECVTYVKNSGIPVLGINIGRLGFLSSVDVSDIQSAISALFNANFSISKRTLLRIRSISGMDIPEPSFAMNDITVSKRDSNSMIVVHAWINDTHMNSYWADGLIVATPTGSTAYSLSCSGPILTPDSQNFILNPIAPHNLSVRPVVFPDHSKIKLEIDGRSKYFHLTLDSRTFSVKTGSTIEIDKEHFQISIVTLPGDTFFQIIRDKLLWGSDKRN
jgi:NAD+ kinase